MAALAMPAGAQAAMPAGFEDSPAITGLTQPVGVDWAANGRAFIVEKHGVLKTSAPGASTATTVIDMKNQVNDYGDNGLETVAVDKSFATNGYVYLGYTVETLVRDSSTPTVSRVVRYTLNPATGQLGAGGGSPTTILGSHNGPCPAPANDVDCMPAESGSHMVGTIRADADGSLWIGHGDGAGFNGVDDSAIRSLDPVSLAGKILHVDRNGNGLPGHAFCPSTTDLTQVCTKVHAKGFRNPFRFQVRPDEKIVLGDVGWNTREEIDVVEKGKSYGWPCREGKIATPGYSDKAYCRPYTTSTETDPIHDYPRCPAGNPPATVCGSAAIGGPDYQGTEFPAGYRGSLFIGDYTSYKIFRLPPDGNGGYGAPQVFSDSWLGTDIEPTPDGNGLAYVNFGWGTGPDGYVGVISYAAGNRTPVASATADRTNGPAPLRVAFDGSGSSDPDGDPLTYDWDFGDGSARSSAAKPTHTYAQPGTYQAKLTVSDGRGKSATKTIAITAGGTAPTATILAPTASTTYRDGEQVQLSGSATDPDEGQLPASALSWQVILHHGDHTHFNSSFPGVAQAAFTAQRDHDADSYYEIRLTATDSQGLTSTKTVEIHPKTTTARIQSTPTGAPVSYGGRAATAPYTATTAIGYDTTVTAAASFTSGGRPFLFERWSDGTTDNTRNIRVPETGVDLRAEYLEDKARGMPATASSVQDGDTAGWGPARAVDGDGDTRWSSDRLDDQWWRVDLGRPRTVDRVQIDWEAAFASRYRVQTSLDGTTWSTAGETTQSSAGSRTTSFATRVARYVRVLGVERGSHYGLSFFEARVLGPEDDTTAPDTTIDSGPAGDHEGTPSFGFSSTEAGSTFQCQVDGGAWEACTSPKAYPSLALGAHTFRVRATDESGNVDASPATRSFTLVDRTAPETSITVGPANGSTITSASTSFSFTSPELGATFECQLDGGQWTACTSPRQLAGLGDGSHTFRVRAKDAAGNADATPETRTFTVDTTPPQTTITGGPQGPWSSTGASFTFTGEAGGSFECQMDSGAWEACASGKAYTGLSEGAHTFRVRAKDAHGNTDPTPAERTFTVDTVAPDTTITDGPQGAWGSTGASFTFTGEAGASFECQMDSGGWEACGSGKAYTGLSEGTHTFRVRAKDAAGNVDPSPATRAFTVDTVAPDTSITVGPPAGGTITEPSTSFTFTSPELGATFECSLDGAAWTACTSPQGYAGLGDGQHTFRVRARDAAGNADASPATRTFTVDTEAPTAAITSGPSGWYRSTSATFGFTSEAGATFECQMDTGAWEACATGKAYTGLGQGAHTFRVRARDAAGNTGPAATQTFTVDTVAPTVTIGSGPSGAVASTTAEFAFSASEAAALRCSMDTTTLGDCTSPKTFANLGQGAHTFRVQATDPAGNASTVASRAFTVDTVGPDASITTGPAAGATIHTSSAAFGFTSPEQGATFECRLDGGPWAACTTPKQLSGMEDGQRTFAVRAVDTLGNRGPERSRTFTVDTAEPDTAITGVTVTERTARVEFESQDATSFECSLDDAAWVACTSPEEYSGLADGTHTVRVRGIRNGITETSPAERTFTVAATPPPIPPAPNTEPAPAPAPPAPPTPPKPGKPSYASTVMQTRGLEAVFGLGDAGRRAADGKGGAAGRFRGEPKRAKPLARSGRDDLARAFDGRDDRIDLDPASLGRPKAFAVELWVDAARAKRTGYLLAAAADRADDGFALALDARTRPVLSARGVRVVGPALGTTRRHVVATYDGRRLRLYVDGRLRATSAPARVTWARSRRLVAGADERGRNHFKGTLDELALYNRALTASTVKAHDAAGRR